MCIKNIKGIRKTGRPLNKIQMTYKHHRTCKIIENSIDDDDADQFKLKYIY